MNLFKKVACFTDIHFGLKSGSRVHNTDCENSSSGSAMNQKRKVQKPASS